MLPKLIVLIISIFVFSKNINSYPLKNWDEAWYAEITRNMASGHYSLLVPFWNGNYYFDKPPLYFWLSLPIFKIFGSGEWQTRIVSVFSAVGASFLVYLIVKKLYNTKTGFLSWLVFITLGQVTSRFSQGNLDALLVFLFLLSFYFYLDKKLVLSGISIGLGFLVKGWLLGLFPIFLITTYDIFVNHKIYFKKLLLMSYFALLTSGWWHILGALSFGKTFVDWYIFNPSAGNISANFSSQLIIDFIRDSGFWWVVLIVSLSKLKKLTFSFEILFSLAFIFLISFSKEKFGWYLLPIYPLVAIWIANNLSKVPVKFLLPIFLVILPLQIINIKKIENIYPDRSLVSANLGKTAFQIVPHKDIIILDDPDFSSFLYYSNHKRIYVASKDGGKSNESWIIKYDNLLNFLNENPKSWIVFQNPEKFNFASCITEKLGYSICRSL